MKVEEYIKICDNVQVSETVRAGYEKAMEQIRAERVHEERVKKYLNGVKSML